MALPDTIFGTDAEGKNYTLPVWFDNANPNYALQKIDLDRLVMGAYNRKA